MNSNKVITIQCSFCHKEFNRTLFRYQYSEKYRGHRHFCSRSCKVRYFNPATIIKLKCNGCHEEMEMELTLYTQRNKTNNGVHYCCNACFQKCRKDRTPFGYFVDKGRQRSKQIGIECDLDNNFLKELWNRQKGICPYTGISMILPETKKEFCKCCSIEKASLDKIDPTKGYVKGNVEFVCQGINFAKHDYSKEDVLRFMEKIRNSS